jgi:ABC-type Fe3+/spermidine/putrescine transport system ATPase subunit
VAAVTPVGSSERRLTASSVELRAVSKRFGGVRAVEGVSLTVGSGEFLTLLGPSGCGKTTLLRLIAGLEDPDEGEIRVGGEVVFSRERGVAVAPGERGVGMVFQDYALWPHMTVAENVAFGLKIRRVKKEEIRRRVRNVLSYLQLEGLEDRYPSELSGGQQQRVALARALVVEPKVLLMDEPLSNLDARLRRKMRTEIRRLHADLGMTVIYVTHDQEEALVLADRIAVMQNGMLLQVGTPREIYERPGTLAVAEFVGEAEVGLLRGVVRKREAQDGVVLELGEQSLLVEGAVEGKEGAELAVVVRPEAWFVEDGGVGGVTARIDQVEYRGGEVFWICEVGGQRVTVRAPREAEKTRGETVRLGVDGRRIRVFDATTGTALQFVGKARGGRAPGGGLRTVLGEG